MRQRLLPRFREQYDTFALRFTCEHCTYFDPTKGRCTHGYPNEEHRLAHYQAEPGELVFCKEFDLV